MIGAATAYIAGSFFASVFSPAAAILFTAGAAAAALILVRRKTELIRDVIMITVCWSVAFGVYSGALAYHEKPAKSLSGTTGSFSGVVEDFDVYDGGKASYTIYGKAGGGRSMRVTCYCDDLGAQLGDRIDLEDCRFELPAGDYLYDSTDYCKSRRIFLRITGGNASLTRQHSHKIGNALRFYREEMIRRFKGSLGQEAGGFLSGMVFGEKQSLDPDLRTALYRTGIGHILAVSGLHVSIIAALIMALMKKLRVNRFVSFGAVNAVMILLILLARSPISAIRAAIMLDLMYSAGLFLRQSDSLNSLSIAALVICIADPFAIHSAGFMLSLSGTFGIAVFGPYMTQDLPTDSLLQRVSKAFAVAFFTTVSVFPLSLMYFDEVSVISPLANLLLVPLSSGAMVLGLIYVGSAGLLPTLYPAGSLIKLVIGASDLISGTGFSHISRSSGKLPMLAAALGGAVLLTYAVFRKRKAVFLTIIISAAVFTSCLLTGALIRRSTFRIAVLGRGSSAAVVVSYKGSYDVFDLSGNYRSPDYVRKYLMQQGAGSADSVFLTKNIQAQYSAYSAQLRLFPSQTWIASGETPVFGGEEVTLFGDDGFTYDGSGYTARYSGGTLTIDRNGTIAAFVPANKGSALVDLTVFYGDLPNGSTPIPGETYLGSGEGLANNFEIVFTDSGTYKTRRL